VIVEIIGVGCYALALPEEGEILVEWRTIKRLDREVGSGAIFNSDCMDITEQSSLFV